jgi:signal transduction histidine kinase
MFAFARKAATLRRYLRFLPPQALLPIGIAGLSFLIDLETPDDIADGFFYIFAVVSCAWVPRVKAALYTACGLLLPIILGSFFSPPTTHGWAGSVNRVLGSILMWLVALVVWRNARSARERELAISQLEQLHGAAERAANAERVELSRWLHEGLAQELAAVGWALDGLANHATDEAKVRSEAAELRSAVDSALRIVHRKAVALRDVEHELGGLPALVERCAADFTRRTDLPVKMLGFEALDLVPSLYAILCLKVVQETLTNVAKHANASHVRIECRNEPEAVWIAIADDGRGIDAAARVKPDSLGLLGLSERLTAIGGALTVSNVEPSGVLVEARVPIL